MTKNIQANSHGVCPMKIFAFSAVLLFCFGIGARAQDEYEQVYVSSCSLYVKATPYTPDSGETSGKAIIEATFCDKAGIPIPGQRIVMTATCGTLLCPQSAIYFSSASGQQDTSCFITGNDGKIQVLLSEIPFNRPGRVAASCAYGDFRVRAASSFSITRKVIKKGSRRKTAGHARTATR